VKALIDRGWAHRLMLGHDYAPTPVSASSTHTQAAIERTRYLFVTTVAVPALIADGVTPETVDVMMREVPRRFLSGEG
jgi:phosphotriesterase-related protein